MFGGKACALLLCLVAKIAGQGSGKKRRTLRHTGYFIVNDQCGRAIDTAHLLHRIATQMRGAPAPGFAFATRLGAINAKPVVLLVEVVVVLRQRLIHCQFILRRDNRKCKLIAHQRMVQLIATAHGNPCKHSEAIEIQVRSCRAVGLCCKSQRSNVTGDAAGVFGRSHCRSRRDLVLHPLVRRVVRFRYTAVLDGYHDGKVVGAPFRTHEPRPFRNLANADLCSIQKIPAAFDINGAPC